MNGRKIMLIVALIFLVLVLALVVYVNNQFKTAATTQAANTQPALNGPIVASAQLRATGLMNFHYSQEYVDYAAVDYAAVNASTVNISIGLYRKNPAAQVFLVNVGTYCLESQCFPEDKLYGYLKAYLQSYGRILNASSVQMININNLTAIPRNALVIIPSGLMPNILLPNTSSVTNCVGYNAPTILDLLRNGDSIVYAGKNFSSSVTCNLQEVRNSPETLKTLSLNNLDTVPVKNLAIAARLSANTPLTFNSPTFVFRNGTEYYGVAAANSSNGSIVALGNSFSGGWNGNTAALASDIASVIESKFWEGRIGYGTIVKTGASRNMRGSVPMLTLQMPVANRSVEHQLQTFTMGAILNSSYSLVTLIFANNNSRYEINLPFTAKYVQNGFVYMTPLLGEQEAGRIDIILNNLTGSQIAVVRIIDINTNRTVQLVDFGSVVNKNDYSKQLSFIITPGFYVAQLEASSSAGLQSSVYSRALLQVVGFNVTPAGLDFKNGTFAFRVISNNNYTTGLPYNVSLNGLYSQSGYIRNGFINYTLPKGTQIPYGNESFGFVVAGNNYTVLYPYKSVVQQIPAIYIEFAIAAVVVVILNKILVPPQVDDYYIDLPSFPVSKKPKLKESAESILNVFDIVNYHYRWHYMPLSVNEVRAGIGTNIKYGNTSIAITSQNTLSVLNALLDRKLVQTADDYFAPNKWIEASKHDIEYLVIFRKIRDYCVANALLFTDLGAAQGTDMIVTAKTLQNYIAIYSSLSGMRDITINSRSKLFVVFLNEERKQEFLDKLYKSYSDQAEVLKMAVDYGYVKLIDTYHLGQLTL